MSAARAAAIAGAMVLLHCVYAVAKCELLCERESLTPPNPVAPLLWGMAKADSGWCGYASAPLPRAQAHTNSLAAPPVPPSIE